MDPTRAAAANVRAHARRALSDLCRCSPTFDRTTRDDTAVPWTPEHVVDQLDRAGLLVPLDLDATSPLPTTPPTRSMTP